MTPENIATCFGPTIVRLKKDSESSLDANSLSGMSVANSLARYMVDNRDNLFDFSLLEHFEDFVQNPKEK